MGTVTGFTAERMQAIEDQCIINGAVVLDNLHLTQRDGTVIDAGNVRGPQGIQGLTGNTGATGPKGAGFYTVLVDLTNISGVAGSAIGDYFVNGDTANHTILGVNTAPGGMVRSTSATAGVAAGNIRGAAGANNKLKQTLTNADNYTFTGLDGANEGPYRIVVDGIINGGLVGSPPSNLAIMQMNGVTAPSYARANLVSWATATDAAQAANPVGRINDANLALGECYPFGITMTGHIRYTGILSYKPIPNDVGGGNPGWHYDGKFAFRRAGGGHHAVQGFCQSYIEVLPANTNITSLKFLLGRNFNGLVTLERLGM